jgi:hypothetical protein
MGMNLPNTSQVTPPSSLEIQMNAMLLNSAPVADYLFCHNSTQSCMDSCTQCHQTLMHTAMQYCLPAGGSHLEAEHFRLMLNCAEMCQTTANFQLSDSQFCKQLALLNAQICEKCAVSCEQIGDMEDCVQACRQCAECCRRLHDMDF